MNRAIAALLGGAMMVGMAGSAEATSFSFDFRAPVYLLPVWARGDNAKPDELGIGRGTIVADDDGKGGYTVTRAMGSYFTEGYEGNSFDIDDASGIILTSPGGGFTADGLTLRGGNGPGYYQFTLGSDGTYSMWIGEVGAEGATLSLRTAANAVPEPATWAMMVAGFAMVAGLMRPRRRGARIVSA